MDERETFTSIIAPDDLQPAMAKWYHAVAAMHDWTRPQLNTLVAMGVAWQLAKKAGERIAREGPERRGFEYPDRIEKRPEIAIERCQASQCEHMRRGLLEATGVDVGMPT